MVLQGIAQSVLSLPTITNLSLVAVALLALVYLFLCPQEAPSSKRSDGSPPQLLLPVGKTAQSFFEGPFEFLADGFRRTSSSIFQFKLFQHGVTAVSGDEARRTFFREKGLNLYEGFQVIVGTIPTGLDPNALHGIYKRLSALQKPDSLQSLLPQLLSDCHRKMDLWGSEGVLDPCSTVHDVTFQMIIRAVSSYEVAENPALVSRLKHLYNIIDSSVKPLTAQFAWVPGLATFRKLWASMSVYRIFNNAVHERKQSGVKRDDTLQQLLDAGEGHQCILGLMMGLPIAGARSTGTIGMWLLTFLSHERSWYAAIRKEIQTLISTYPPTTPSPFSGQSILQALSAIPLTAWESETPQLDLCIRETLRRAQPHTAVRKNLGPDLSFGDYTVPSGGFVVYPFSDSLLNPAFYPDPFRWDPARSVVQRHHDDDDAAAAFIGWGAGKHMCKGQRLASLTMKLVVAYAAMRFDMAAVGARTGETLRDQPVPDWNDFLTCRPLGDCSLRFSERPGWVESA